MSRRPEEIWKEIENNTIDIHTATDLLMSLIEESEKHEIRLEAIEIIVKILPSGDKLFKILENLVVSEEDAIIRYIAIKLIGDKYMNNAFSLLKWALQNENDYHCLFEVVNQLGKLNIPEVKTLLYNEVQIFIKKKYLNEERKIKNKKINKTVSKIFRIKDYREFHPSDIALILINLLTISGLFMKYHNISFELNSQKGLIEKLDLSDIEYEVKGTPWEWKNNIFSLSEILGIEYLTGMHYLDLSNNLITELKEITKLPNITHLILRNNKICDRKNLDYLNSMPNLKYVDLRGNEIVNIVQKSDFDPNLRVLLYDSYIKIE
jgi:Leucine-rich repeat (LRR) protein